MDKTYLSSLSIKSWNSQLKQDAQWVCEKSALKDHKLGIMNFKGQEFKFFVKYWYSLINLELYNSIKIKSSLTTHPVGLEIKGTGSR